MHRHSVGAYGSAHMGLSTASLLGRLGGALRRSTRSPSPAAMAASSSSTPCMMPLSFSSCFHSRPLPTPLRSSCCPIGRAGCSRQRWAGPGPPAAPTTTAQQAQPGPTGVMQQAMSRRCARTPPSTLASRRQVFLADSSCGSSTAVAVPTMSTSRMLGTRPSFTQLPPSPSYYHQTRMMCTQCHRRPPQA